MAYISKKIREFVQSRAKHCCEYCLIPEKASFFTYQVEHIISQKHKGSHDLGNLAFACPICNRCKGTDLGTNVGNPPILTRFYNPRSDEWSNHFQLLSNGFIEPKTDIGRATVQILKLNHWQSVEQREKLIFAGVL